MGWEIKEKETEGGEKLYRIWSSYTHTDITDWITRSELILEINKSENLRMKEKIIKEFYSFPNGWTSKNGLLKNREGYLAFTKWQDVLFTLENKDYIEYVNKEYDRIMEILKKEVDNGLK